MFLILCIYSVNYILIAYELSNCDHMLGIVSHIRVSGGIPTNDPHPNNLAHYPLDYQVHSILYYLYTHIAAYNAVYLLNTCTVYDFTKLNTIKEEKKENKKLRIVFPIFLFFIFIFVSFFVGFSNIFRFSLILSFRPINAKFKCHLNRVFNYFVYNIVENYLFLYLINAPTIFNVTKNNKSGNKKTKYARQPSITFAFKFNQINLFFFIKKYVLFSMFVFYGFI